MKSVSKVNAMAQSIKYREKRGFKKNDRIYTPKPVAEIMINMCNIKEGDKVLDPSRGGGVFYNLFPKNCKKYYCEIQENKDFFKFYEKMDWVIGNPPYSLWDEWLDHTMKITDKFCYIFGVWNMTSARFERIFKNGYGVTKISTCKVNWWFGNSWIVVFEKNKESIIKNYYPFISCDLCDNRQCKRGMMDRQTRQKYGANYCPTNNIEL
tara:strand:+ start:312 stop:938 length:627 start_codon:yes stop_codon:yes gene_type:complete